MRRAAAAALCTVSVVGLAACESNQERSAAIARQGHHAIAAGVGLRVKAANADVRVVGTTLINGVGGAQAVAVLLRDGGSAQAHVPVLVHAGSYTNAAAGLQPSLQQIALIAPGHDAWWVDDQVTGATGPGSVRVRVGSGRPAGHVPAVSASDVHLAVDDTGAATATATLTNRSGVAQTQMPVFAVALRGGRVVAAGRAIVATLPASATPVPHAFQVFFVGNPAHAQVQLTLAPTAGAQPSGG